MMPLFEQVDLYCERTGPGFWAEPVNALTNLLFLVGAWFAYRRANHVGANTTGTRFLLMLMCSIGVGSFLFHTFATQWARVLDVLPILFFQLVYAWLYCRKIIRMRLITAHGIVLGYLMVALIMRFYFKHYMNGSLIYAPALLFMVVLGIYHIATHRNERYIVQCAACVFILALACRTLDMAVCPYYPLGIHFIWHICNACVLYMMLRGLIANDAYPVKEVRLK